MGIFSRLGIYHHSPVVQGHFHSQKHTPPTVFNLQAFDWVYYEEETGTHTGKCTAIL